MDTLFEGFPGSLNGFKFDHNGSVSSSCSNQNHVRGFILNNDFCDPHHPLFLENSNPNPPTDCFQSSSETTSCSDGGGGGDYPESSEITQDVLKFINEILMEEDLEGKTCMLQDCLALQAAEKSFYDVLGQKYPPSTNHNLPCLQQNFDNPDENFTQSNSIVIQHFNESRESSSSYVSRGRKNHPREDSDYLEEGRSNKHSAISLSDQPEESDMFDEVLLCKSEDDEPGLSSFHYEGSQSGSNRKLKSSNRGKSSTKKRDKKRDVVDLSSLLTLCAQAVASGDQRTANEVLKQIRQHSSALGDGTQRLAHYFCNGLEARLVGTKTNIYEHISCRASAANILKAYKVAVNSCPFQFTSFSMSNQMILKVAEKATKLHIIVFGICYGFQWPCLIQRLSQRPNGPPMLRITGIELPQPGFHPAERVEDTGRRLRGYCERFNVPFECHAIAQKWETIKLEDFKIDRDEVIVVNCSNRMQYVSDDTAMASDCPRDAVLNLIKEIHPDVFIHGILNGTHSAPFFLTRFREALYYFSAHFDMFDATVPREDEGRLLFEREFFGYDAMNAIAFEGTERVERPETYKQWRVRTLRAGFRQLPLDQEVLKKAKTKVKALYHQDFVVDEDAHWVLQGWKGKILQALSFWKPVQDD
ncbi:hypothetical protein Ddye_024319 [Dipteronia dyeriana]|uniref:Uncharacterized protein n=1 Tax=Dipteronia dyeriana TaxID=168575 RepID=A0AAD9WTG9_9ROSI|nr:hypothetical protein Ddye_024319 [Dipteronia dyeriana]